jgi:hypothetical protein
MLVLKPPRPLFLCCLGIAIGVLAVYGFQSRANIADWFSERLATSPPSSSSPTGTIYEMPSAPEPIYADVPKIREAFALAPGQTRYYNLGNIYSDHPIALKWASSSPADIGLVPTFVVTQGIDFHALVARSFCHQVQALSFETACVLPPEGNGLEMTLLVVDSRNGASTFAGIAAGVLGGRNAVDQAVTNNRASLVLTQHSCVRNCP